MIRRAWARATRSFREAAAIIADEQARPQSPVPPPFASPSGGGAGPCPVPGTTGVPPAPSAAETPPRPSPAPAPPVPAHTAGPVAFIVYGWECGCELDFDGSGRVIWATGCGRSKQDDFEDFLKGLTDDQH